MVSITFSFVVALIDDLVKNYNVVAGERAHRSTGLLDISLSPNLCLEFLIGLGVNCTVFRKPVLLYVRFAVMWELFLRRDVW